MMIRLLVLALLLPQAATIPVFDVSSLTIAPPALVCELDLNQLKGEMRRLSWSPDGRNLHVQTADGTVKHDDIVTVLDGVVSGAIVFVGRGDRLTLMDQDARRKVVGTIKGASMPAWSTDGSRLAFLQKAGKKRYRLMTAAVGRATI